MTVQSARTPGETPAARGPRVNAGSVAVWAVLSVLLSVALKACLLAVDAFPFNADEAIVALMARHILQGKWPAFFYGQAYMGSLDASLAALGFSLFGEHVQVIRTIQVLLYAGTVFTGVWLSWRVTKSRLAAAVAGLLMAIPTVNLTLYTTASLGGYGEALLLGQCLMLLTLVALEHARRPLLYAAWGAMAGLGFWAFGLTLVYIIPSAMALAWRDWRSADRRGLAVCGIAAVAAAAVGMIPWIASAAAGSSGVLLRELFGSAIAGASSSSLPVAWLEHIRNLLLLGGPVILGFRAPWDTRWLGLPLLPFALAIWACVFLHALFVLRRRDDQRAGRWMVAGVAVMTVAGFVFTSFGADPSGRYFLPMWMPMSLFAGSMAADLQARTNRRWLGAFVVVLLAFNLWGTVDSALRNPPGITTQFDPVARIDTGSYDELAEFLEAQGERTGYTNYWVAYPLAFLSHERLIYVPRLPYHEDFRYTARDDRYAPYDVIVGGSSRVAYITTNHPALNDALRSRFGTQGITFAEADVGGFHVFYGLSERVTPEMIGLSPEDS
ncbi:MAG: glycosyltransferase family 39 protein [Chloroflexi bacterium]|nr:glycosyltransferase family 39 protein [Chloroflexota bacterium]